MALIVQNHPEFVGTMAFIMACNCSPETFDASTGFHTVTVCGVKLRITADLEYVVEQDLFVAKKKTSMEERKIMTASAYRVRAAYSTTRIESQVGHRRLTVYRELRKDENAPIFFAKSRAQGGKTPPPVMAVSIMRYYVDAMDHAKLGLDKFPEFMALLQGIELLPGCNLDEALRGKHMRNLIAQSSVEEDEETTDDKSTPAAPPPPPLNDQKDPLKFIRKELKSLRAEILLLKTSVEELKAAHTVVVV